MNESRRLEQLKKILEGEGESHEADSQDEGVEGEGEGDEVEKQVEGDEVENKEDQENREKEQNQSETKEEKLNRKKSKDKEGICILCETQDAEVKCEVCQDIYCEVCFFSQHRKGARKNHPTTILIPNQSSSLSSRSNSTVNSIKSSKSSKSSKSFGRAFKKSSKNRKEEKLNQNSMDTTSEENSENESNSSLNSTPDTSDNELAQQPTIDRQNYFVERAKYIPLRLNFPERKYLRLLEAAITVSDYTQKVDGTPLSKTKRMHCQLKEICAILCALVIGENYEMGQSLLEERNYSENAEFFTVVFEIARRYKIMNPEKMRNDYGKLIYLLQDSCLQEISPLLQFDLIAPIKTVYSLLKEYKAEKLLEEELLWDATKEITPEGKSRAEIQYEIKKKERAIEELSSKYARAGLNKEQVCRCLYSIGDNHSFLRVSRDPVERMLEYLRKYYQADEFEEGHSLAISTGVDGARLTHSHNRQYSFVEQSLTLWKEISHEMFKLWMLSEEDLLEKGNRYDLKDTGQGLHRVQHSPKVSKEMQRILYKTQVQLGHWVGSSVIHLGDTNVPNALMFIDKYTQVSRILNPIVSTLNKIDRLMVNPSLKIYINNAFEGEDNLKKTILTDFFRHAFDGSGADNFFDAGSCIDGRLTSAWNWCSMIEKKPYFPIFLLTDFTGFDGKF